MDTLDSKPGTYAYSIRAYKRPERYVDSSTDFSPDTERLIYAKVRELPNAEFFLWKDGSSKSTGRWMNWQVALTEYTTKHTFFYLELTIIDVNNNTHATYRIDSAISDITASLPQPQKPLDQQLREEYEEAKKKESYAGHYTLRVLDPMSEGVLVSKLRGVVEWMNQTKGRDSPLFREDGSTSVEFYYWAHADLALASVSEQFPDYLLQLQYVPTAKRTINPPHVLYAYQGKTQKCIATRKKRIFDAYEVEPFDINQLS